MKKFYDVIVKELYLESFSLNVETNSLDIDIVSIDGNQIYIQMSKKEAV
jgi:hypothetical protein